MDEQTCIFCRHFCTEDDGDDVGWCRRYPPQLLTDEEGKSFSQFPLVAEGSSCGEFVRRCN